MARGHEFPVRGVQSGFPEDLLGDGLVQGQQGRARVRALIGHADAFEHALHESVLAGRAVQVDEGEIPALGGCIEPAQIPRRVEKGHIMPQGGQAFLDLPGSAQGDFAFTGPSAGDQKNIHG